MYIDNTMNYVNIINRHTYNGNILMYTDRYKINNYNMSTWGLHCQNIPYNSKRKKKLPNKRAKYNRPT